MGRLRSSGKQKILGLIAAIFIISVGVGIAYTMNNALAKVPIKKFFSETDTNAVWDWANINNHNTSDLSETANFLYMHQINTVYVDISIYGDIMKTNNQTEREERTEQLSKSI